MFNTKPDRQVVEITVQFNIFDILDWLKSGARSEDIGKIDKNWGHNMVQKYVIDMLPIGKTSNAYFHRGKGLISQKIAGIDYLNNADEETKFFAKKQKLEALEWSIWNGCLLLMIHVDGQRKIISATPVLTEVIELEKTGKIKDSRNSLRDEDIKISVPISLNEEGGPKDSIDMWKWYAILGQSSVSYGNGLGRISFSSSLLFEVEY